MGSVVTRLGGAVGTFRRIDGWTVGTVVIALAASVLIVAVIGLALTPGENVWGHLASTVLPLYVRTTILLMAGVGLGTLVIGAGPDGAEILLHAHVPGVFLPEPGALVSVSVDEKQAFVFAID